jgi:hypothetical protein
VSVKYCAYPGCGRSFIQGAGQPSTLCPEHRALPRSQGGTYGGTHRSLQEDWRRRIDFGESAVCGEAVCLHDSRLIPPFTAFDLGHRADGSESPSHPDCNRAAGGRSAVHGRRVAHVAPSETVSARAMQNYLTIGGPLPQVEHRSPQWQPGDPPPKGDVWKGCTCLYTVEQSGFMPTQCY